MAFEIEQKRAHAQQGFLDGRLTHTSWDIARDDWSKSVLAAVTIHRHFQDQNVELGDASRQLTYGSITVCTICDVGQPSTSAGL